MKRIRWAALVGLAIATAACGSSGKSGPQAAPTDAGSSTTLTTAQPSEAPDVALRRQVLELSRGQYGLAWDELVPAQQALVTRDRFINCRSVSPNNGTFVTVDKILATYAETVQVPGTTVSLPSTALTVIASVGEGASKQSTTTTVHEFAVGGMWRWNVDIASADGYKLGTCPP